MIKRLVYLLALVAMLAGGVAKAVTYPYPAVLNYRAEFPYEPNKFNGPYQTSVGAACDDMARLYGSIVDPGWKYVVSICNTSTRAFQIKTETKVPANSYSGTIAWYLRCPQGGILKNNGNNTGVCNEDPNAPPPAPVCTAGSQVRVTYKVIDAKGNVLPKAPLDGATDGQCKLKLVDVKSCVLATDEASYCTYIGERTGEPLAASDKVPAPTAEMPAKPGEEPVPTNAGSVKDGTACPKGTVPAGFGSDGLISCVGTGSAPKNPSAAPPTATTSATTTNPDGSTTTTTTTVKTNADGSKTTTVDKVTTPAGGGGTVTKEQTKDTSATPSGGAGKETPEKPQEQQNFCKQNPNLAVCRESSVSGSCGQTSCTGDAVQCATLAAARAMECKQRSDEDTIKGSRLFNEGQSAANGNDPREGSLPAPGNGEKLVVPELNADGWLGGGSPMPDISFTIQGRTITVPISKATEYLVALRYALMVVASLISFRMLSGSILKE